jgi:hypothetical protein
MNENIIRETFKIATIIQELRKELVVLMKNNNQKNTILLKITFQELKIM